MKTINSETNGVTLIEMLIVILILGLLIAVGYRTIDAVNYASRFNKTNKQMAEIVKGFVGNPDLVSDGRRISFGYVGDMGRLPVSLSALIKSDGPNWKGPYLPRQFVEDTISFKSDGWGDTFVYNQQSAYIRSTGNGKQFMTMKIVDTITNLFNNSVSGTITDINSAPPAEFSQKINIRLTIPRDGVLVDTNCTPRADGYYEFSPVPIGYHRMVVTKQFGIRDSVVRWISVLPRSNIIADFRFPYSFRGNLKYVENSGSASGQNMNNVGFTVFNSGDSLVVDSLVMVSLDTIAFYEEVYWQGTKVWDYSPSPPQRNGVGDIAAFNPIQSIGINKVARVEFNGFKLQRTAQPADPVNMTGIRIVIKFSDGSIIDFRPQ